MNLLGAFTNINVGQLRRVKTRKRSSAKGSAGKGEAPAHSASPLPSAREYETTSTGRHTSTESIEAQNE